eukprot:scaffold150166_cov35-Tisochrysis_lutea.AAC.1
MGPLSLGKPNLQKSIQFLDPALPAVGKLLPVARLNLGESTHAAHARAPAQIRTHFGLESRARIRTLDQQSHSWPSASRGMPVSQSRVQTVTRPFATFCATSTAA